MAEVYQEDGAMAVLMANTATTPTEPGGGEETPDVQDPCKDLIELRVKKVWKGDEEKDRPNEVVFQIIRTYEVNGQETTDINFNKEVILTKEDAQTADIWEKVLSGPEYTASMSVRMENITIHTISAKPRLTVIQLRLLIQGNQRITSIITALQ